MIPYYKIFLMASWLCSQGVRAESRELVKIPLPDLKSVSALPNQDKQIDAALKSDGEKKIADGSRYFLRQKGFSFIPPIGWERIQTQSGLLFQMPKEPNLDYQKTLQVLFFNGGVKWDNYSLESFGRLLLDRFSKRSNLVANYRLLNSASFPLTNTSPAQAYYTAFLYGSMPMMQLHILISNASRVEAGV